MMSLETVTLKGGPCDGFVLPDRDPTVGVVVELPDEPGRVARYRPSRVRGVLCFREYDTIVARVPWVDSQEQG